MIPGMQRVRLAWLVAISLMSVGSLAAHSLAYRLVEPSGSARAELLSSTGHGYLAALPAVLAACCAVGVAALAVLAVRAARGRAPVDARWPLALLPLLGFAVQEHLERLFAGAPVAGAALDPSFLVGVALQIPFAVAAIAVARLLCRAADSIGRALSSPFAQRGRARQDALPRGTGVILPRLPALALGSSGRGPPLRSNP